MTTSRTVLAVLILACLFVLSSCSSALIGYLVYDYLNDSAPKLWWNGTVTDSQGDPVEGVRVQVRAEVLGQDDVLAFSDVTDESGDYMVKFRWSSEVEYTIRVYDEQEQPIYEKYIGDVIKEDQKNDISLEGVFNAEVSGVVRDADGNTLQNVILIAAITDSLEASPTFLRDSENELVYDETNEGGIYSITGRMLDYSIICAYHPDHGFAYAYAEDTDSDGSIGLNLTMGAAGDHNIDIQVVNGLGLPIVSQVLDIEQQFRVHLSQRWDFSEEMDEVVTDNGLFPGRNVTPSDQHPTEVTFSVQATDGSGISEGIENQPGSTYDISLLRIGDDQPATALVTSENPLALSDDSVIVVRIN